MPLNGVYRYMTSQPIEYGACGKNSSKRHGKSHVLRWILKYHDHYRTILKTDVISPSWRFILPFNWHFFDIRAILITDQPTWRMPLSFAGLTPKRSGTLSPKDSPRQTICCSRLVGLELNGDVGDEKPTKKHASSEHAIHGIEEFEGSSFLGRREETFRIRSGRCGLHCGRCQCDHGKVSGV